VHLADHARDVYSQFGEDGILSELLRRIGDEHLTRWCVEFGAWDGVFLSNTCNLIREHGFCAVLIEGDPKRAAAILRNHPPESVTVLTTFVGLDAPHRLDDLLATTPIPERFDVLSIDIDGADYWILESLERYRPKIVVIEYNPSIPNAVHFVQERSTGVSHGSSARAIAELAASKGYRLSAVTTTNLILVAAEHAEAALDPPGAAGIADESPAETLARLRTHEPNYVFSLFDGTVLSSRPIRLPWHGTTLPSNVLYRPPRWFASYPDSWSTRRALWWRVYRRFVLPRRSRRPH